MAVHRPSKYQAKARFHSYQWSRDCSCLAIPSYEWVVVISTNKNIYLNWITRVSVCKSQTLQVRVVLRSNLTGPKGLQTLGMVRASISTAPTGCPWIGERVNRTFWNLLDSLVSPPSVATLNTSEGPCRLMNSAMFLRMYDRWLPESSKTRTVTFLPFTDSLAKAFWRSVSLVVEEGFEAANPVSLVLMGFSVVTFLA